MSLDDRRAGFKRYKEDVKKRGKPFYPFAMFHDTVMSLVVVCVITGLAVIWKSTTGDTTSRPGWLGKLYDDRPTPGRSPSSRGPTGTSTSSSTCCRIFKWPDDGDPRHDRRPDALPRPAARAAVRRPAARSGGSRAARSRSSPPRSSFISMGVLTYKGATAKEALASEAEGGVPTLGEEARLPEQPGGARRREAVRGRPAAPTATPTSARAAARTSARRISPRRARRARASSSRSTT